MVSGLKANYDALKAHYADKYANKSDPPPERMSRYRSPAGGMLVRGLFYPGGKMVPKEATEAKPAPSSKPVEPAGPKPKPKPDRKQSAKRKRKKPSGNAEGRDPFF